MTRTHLVKKKTITATKPQNTVQSHPEKYSQGRKSNFIINRMFCRGFMGLRGIVLMLIDRKFLLHRQLNQSYIL